MERDQKLRRKNHHLKNQCWPPACCEAGWVHRWMGTCLGEPAAHLLYSLLLSSSIWHTTCHSTPPITFTPPKNSFITGLPLQKLPAVSLDVMLVCWCSGGYCPKCALMVSLMATSTIPPPPPTSVDQPRFGRPSTTQGEFTRLHHVMLILITVPFSPYQTHRNSLLSQKLAIPRTTHVKCF